MLAQWQEIVQIGGAIPVPRGSAGMRGADALARGITRSRVR
ncbi:hypothetical protein BM43_2661 [Burkholderia gladioli]|uniref:Uncharacterized protein n=1 Tax=Burkholderia gladioli TaxID=28095 RepID=A0AAW3ESB5_BURGA|nr:hypothetical protein BM43_2661 [Burkholderia gladioli]KGC09795.1 hypothetical protein DM48_6236 [Burkholderia gladioli]SPV11152.1 Uncharacterised protein [Burkholderia gladioli]